MSLIRTIAFLLVACLITVAPTAAQLRPGASSSRGELLYSTHCIACHMKEVHWRQKKLATDWASLKSEVWRWATNAGVGWSDEDIEDVARYLNASQYRFEAPPASQLGVDRSPDRTARTD